MNRIFIAALVAGGLAAGSAMAQSTTPSTTTTNTTTTTTPSTPPSTTPSVTTGTTTGSGTTTTNSAVTNSSANPPAIATPGVDSQTLAAPVPGANSFTQTQARERLEAHGYTDVSGLKLDDEQIWRGKATKNGVPVKVALDYQGNIVSQQ